MWTSTRSHRWDYETPIEETLDALNDVVKSGKVRYIGASSMHAWQFARALYLADLHGWTRFVSMQNHYNLLYREEEREMIPLCQSEGIGIIPWSPLARGRLARPWQTETTKRLEADQFGKTLYSEDRRNGPASRRSRGKNFGEARHPTRTGRAGLDARQVRDHVPDCRCDETEPSFRRRGGSIGAPDT